MGFKKTTRSLDFADLAIANCLEQNRRIKFSRGLESDRTVRNDTPDFGLKEHASVDTKHGLVLATTLTPAPVHDTNLLPYCTVFSRHTKRKIKKLYADKGYAGHPNLDFLALKKIENGIMRKDSTTAKLTWVEILRNKLISKIRYTAFSVAITIVNDTLHRAMVYRED